MSGLLHLVQRGGAWQAGAPPSPLLAVPNVTAHPSTASVLIIVLLYDGPLFCGFNVAIKRLIIFLQFIHVNHTSLILLETSSCDCYRCSTVLPVSTDIHAGLHMAAAIHHIDQTTATSPPRKLVAKADVYHIPFQRYSTPLLAGFRTGHSTETALLEMLNDVYTAGDDRRLTVAIGLDISAAFDTISHDVLIDRLHVDFGLSSTALN